MTVFELESKLVEFIAKNTSELMFRSNEQTVEMIPPQVYSGFIPRDEVGSIIPGEITVYPAIIVNAQTGSQQIDREVVTVGIVIGCYDSTLDQQGYRDCCNLIQRLKDRFREIDVIDEAFFLSKENFLLNWQLNRRGNVLGSNSYPYFFAEMQANFELPVMATQFEMGIWEGDKTPGRYNEKPIPSEPPLEHDKYPVPPPIKWVEGNYGEEELPKPKPRPPEPEPEPEPEFDSDALAFFGRANITDATQQDAINVLVLDLKAANVWSKMRVLYPFAGGSAASHSENLKSDSYDIIWNGSITHDANGVTGGLDGYGDTGLNANTTTFGSIAFGVYQRKPDADVNRDIATRTTGGVEYAMYLNFGGVFYGVAGTSGASIDASMPDAKGFFVLSRQSVSSYKAYKNGIQIGATRTEAPDPLPNLEFRVLLNANPHNLALAFISDGLSDVEVALLSTAVLTYQTSLNRNV